MQVVAPGTNGNVLKSNGTTWVSSPGFGNNVNVTTTYSALVGDKIMTDSSGGVFTITLPATAAFGDEIEVFDATDSWTGNNVTLDRNGLKIDGASTDLVLNVNGANVRLKYYDATQGWRVYP